MRPATQPERDHHVKQNEFLNQLIEAGLLLPSGVRGVYGRNATFERIVRGFGSIITKIAKDDGAEFVDFPPLVTRSNFEKTDYARSFPHLMGSIHSFFGDDARHEAMLETLAAGGDWSTHLGKSDLMLCPAACYPLYPTLRGTLPEDGRLVDLMGFVFRHEPSDDPARMQMFRQRENIRIGSEDDVREFRDRWLERGQAVLASIGLDAQAEVANDPFFGQSGRLLSVSQRAQALKFELLYPIHSADAPTALSSCNYHQDHFGRAYDIRLPDGSFAHTACVGFGVERVALALLKTHGLSPPRWPVSVRTALDLD
ncbi:amino acid--[acyl-carrier-protein] ligase [Sorangium sp. So ce131]|uniref:amino acid--[acyl-carrier-protein] ligase n=1 Tax=Sorangium sp. So ce131 TaxID=3133282 RepID=UPI003F5E5A4A